MDARRLLQRMCERHGLAASRADEFEPLVERALISPENVRTRILEIIDDNLARRAGGDEDATLDSVQIDLDEEVLLAVATKLHNWAPSDGLARFGTLDATPNDAAAESGEGLDGGEGGDFGAGLGPGPGPAE